jgi:hypothetical protein
MFRLNSYRQAHFQHITFKWYASLCTVSSLLKDVLLFHRIIKRSKKQNIYIQKIINKTYNVCIPSVSNNLSPSVLIKPLKPKLV